MKTIACRRITVVDRSYAIERESSSVQVELLEKVGIGIRYGFAGHNVIGKAFGQLYLIAVTKQVKDAIRKACGVSPKERAHGIYWCDLHLSSDDVQ